MNMYNNIEKINIESTSDLEGRQSLGVPSHGKVPKWLEEISKSVEQNYMLTTNDKLRLMHDDVLLNKESVSSSAKYGRRAAALYALENQKNSDKEENYIVPKLDEISLNEFIQSQNNLTHFSKMYNSFAVPKSESNSNDNLSKTFVFSHIPSIYLEDDLRSYNPSMLDPENGRHSRIDVIENSLNNTLISAFQDFSVNKPSHDLCIKHFKSNSMPDEQLYVSNSIMQHPEREINTIKSMKQSTSHVPNIPLFENYDSILNKLLNVDEDNFYSLNLESNHYDKDYFKEFKIKPQKSLTLPSKKSRYKKYKFRKGHNSSLFRTDSLNLLKDSKLCEVDYGNKEEDDMFIIPVLPVGKYMTIDILSTWGDRNYVGLNGIEIFSSDGTLAVVTKITASPSDINSLPDCDGDPRIITNLLDGVNRTQDDVHIWLAPFHQGSHHFIHIEFEEKTELAMLRIWNYNKSRIHSYRGAKDVTIILDKILIFKGEIAQACGSIQGSLETFGDTVLFTTDEEILEKVSRSDTAYVTLISISRKDTPERIERPLTGSADESFLNLGTYSFMDKPKLDVNTEIFAVRNIDIVLMQNWGNPIFIGLCGLEVIGECDITIELNEENLHCTPDNSTGIINRLIDGHNVTSDLTCMWYSEYRQGQDVVLTISFHKITYVTGIRMWNYNENYEMTFAGVRLLKIYLDNKPLVNTFLNNTTFILRRAPGNCNYDYVQEINFCESSINDSHEEKPFYDFSGDIEIPDPLFEQPSMPEGFVFQIVVYTTWGDQYYVGLNGIELYDQNGKKIHLTESNICAHPESINVLPGISGDIRTPDKLIDNINDQSSGLHSWLAPVVPKCLNRIYIVFDHPTTVSVIKLWNYYKTLIRGVREFGILVDDLLVYNGILDQANPTSSVKHRTILFTDNKNVVQKEMASLVKHSIDSQRTVLMNNDLRMTTGGSLPNADQSLRPFTSVNRGKSSSN